MTDFSTLLNPEQCAAATAGGGPLLVLAAAGTGKTRTLVHRVAYLVEQGEDPSRILLLTFTNRAAREMLDRAQKVVGSKAAMIWSGTFHSVCARLLRRYGMTLGYQPGFQILDEEDQKKLIGEIIKTVAKDPKEFPKKELVAKMISEAVNEQKPVAFVASRWLTKTAGVEPEEISKVAEIYDSRKMELGAMDFDDLIVNGLKLLKTNDSVRGILQEHFRHVLVDEYQDTNFIQAEFTDLLAAKHRNIMAVGDDFQCIYTWRGAQIENIMNFPERWKGCRVIKLERNYRSVAGVLDVANVVMKDAPNQFEKILKPARKGGLYRPMIYRGGDGRSQASEILNMISNARRIGYRYRDIAILYRSHYQSIDIQMTLARMKIPFHITSGVGVFEKIHVKDTLAYLRLLINPHDELSFDRVMSLLPGVGEKTIRKFWEKLSRQFDPKRKEDRDALYSLLGVKARELWPAFAKAMEGASNHLDNEEYGILIEDFCNFFYEDHLRKSWEDSEAEDRLSDIHELSSSISDAEGGLEGFLNDVALLTNLDHRKNNPDSDEITLSTVHQAKGMEWPVVIIPWLSEGMFPSQKAGEEGRMDEERRLFYVAVTRAKDELYMISPQTKKNPDGGMFPVEASMFLREIPQNLVEYRRIYSESYNAGYGSSYNGGYGRRASYGGSYGGPSRSPKPVLKTTWRR